MNSGAVQEAGLGIRKGVYRRSERRCAMSSIFEDMAEGLTETIDDVKIGNLKRNTMTYELVKTMLIKRLYFMKCIPEALLITHSNAKFLCNGII